MIVYRQNDDYEPLTWVRGHPVYVTTLFVVGHVIAYLVAMVVGFASGGGMAARLLQALTFRSNDILERGAFWEWGTYFIVHQREHPLFFALEMACFYFFGKDVEQYIGRRKFVLLYSLLVFIPPVALTILGLVIPTHLEGAWAIHFAVFLTFAKVYPGVEFFLRIRAIWLAIGLLVLAVVMDAAGQQWGALLAVLITSSTAWLYLMYLQGTLPSLSAVKEHFAAPKPPDLRPMPPRLAVPDPMEQIDPLLDKIAESGMESLTPEEREKLERARRALMGKPDRSG